MKNYSENSFDNKIDFLKNELWILAWNASVQRANLYKKTNDEEKNEFKSLIKTYIEKDILKHYQGNNCTEERHYKNLSALVNYGNEIAGNKILKDKYRYGIAQKLLNLYLKYLWCIKLIHTPPHCPIDRIIINKLKLKCNWTQINDEKYYRRIIEKIKKTIKLDEEHSPNESIAEWELKVYSRRNLKKT